MTREQHVLDSKSHLFSIVVRVLGIQQVDAKTVLEKVTIAKKPIAVLVLVVDCGREVFHILKRSLAREHVLGANGDGGKRRGRLEHHFGMSDRLVLEVLHDRVGHEPGAQSDGGERADEP